MSTRAPGVLVDVRKRVRARTPSRAEIARWTGAALGRRARGREIGVSVVGPAESRRLNARFRGRPRPTNVLSFPAPPMPGGVVAPLGDLVICPQVLREEARQQGK